MQFKQLFDDDRAVSPVIGVILMVAITVILAAVIGTFVLGLGDQVQSTTPQASFGFDQSTETVQSGGQSSEITTVTVTHETGDSIAESDISVSVGGNTAWSLTNASVSDQSRATNPWGDSGEKVSAGSSFQVYLYDSGTSISEGDPVDAASGDGYSGDATELASGDTVRVIYDSPDSDSSSTLGKYEVQ